LAHYNILTCNREKSASHLSTRANNAQAEGNFQPDIATKPIPLDVPKTKVTIPIPISAPISPPVLFSQQANNLADMSPIVHAKLLDGIITNQSPEVFKPLLLTAIAQGLNIDERDLNLGRTLLHFAVVYDRQAIANILVENGASLSIRSGSRKNCADYGRQHSRDWVSTLRSSTDGLSVVNDLARLTVKS